MDCNNSKGSSCVSNSEVGGSASQTSAHVFAHTTTKPIATNTNLVASRDYRVQSSYERYLQPE